MKGRKIERYKRMGTRGAIGFRIDNTDKITYNHWDSYPSVLGAQVLADIHKISLTKLRDVAKKIVLIDGKTPPTEKQIKNCEKWTDLEVSEQSTSDWYCLLRKAQGTLEPYIKGLKVMVDSHEFLNDSLFCEWAYIVNLDDKVLEVYKGFNQSPTAKGRYAANKLPPSLVTGQKYAYNGVVLVDTVPLSQINRFGKKGLSKLVDKWRSPRVGKFGS